MRNTLACVLGLSLATGCTMLSDTSSRVEGAGGGAETTACKIEGSQIGEDGLVMRLGERTVTFHDWVGKTGENNEYVGFSITITGASSLGYVVKSGGEREHSTSTSWLNAAGPDGADMASGISNVDFCENCTDGSCDDGDGDGDGDGGGDGGDDGSDGCIEGCDDGSGGDGGGDGDGGGGDGDGGGGDGDGGSDGCIEGCDDGSGGGGGVPEGDDGEPGDGDCFEPGGCNGPTDAPPITDGDDGDGTVLL